MKLSEREINRLVRGDILVLNIQQAVKESSLGAEAVALMKTDREDLKTVLLDYNNYAGSYPEVVDCRILEQEGDRWVVSMDLSINPLLPGYHVKLDTRVSDDRIVWDMLEGDFKQCSGHWIFERLDGYEDRVLLMYNQRVELKGLLSLIPSFILNRVIEYTFPGVIKNLKKVLKKRGLPV